MASYEERLTRDIRRKQRADSVRADRDVSTGITFDNEIGVRVHCPEEDCDRIRSCSIAQITGVIVTYESTKVQAKVNIPEDCSRTDCVERSFTAQIPHDTNVNRDNASILRVLVPETVVQINLRA